MNTKRSEMIDFADMPNDNKFTWSFWKGFLICTVGSFLVVIGVLWAEVNYDNEIHSFLRSKSFLIVSFIGLSIGGVSWLVWRIKNKFY